MHPFNFKSNPISRLPIKIDAELYPKEFEFISGNKYQGFDISNHIDDLALVYFDENEHLVLHMFVPEGTAKKIFVNRQAERRLYRYSKFECIKKAYENGIFWVLPAIEYLKNELDDARRDNELVHKTTLSSKRVKITLKKDNSEINPIGDITESTLFLAADSYILCFSYDFDEGLYDEFKDSDSCLIINDTVEFAKRIHQAFELAMPHHSGVDARVTYSKHQSHFGPLFSKPIKYIYQREYRFAWISNNSKLILNPNILIENNIDEIKKMIPKPVELNLGSLKDIANIVVRNK